MNPRDWTNLQLSIENENCILLLGPGASGTSSNGSFLPFMTEFSRKLASELEATKKPFEAASRDQLDYIAQVYLNDTSAAELDAAYQARSFYQKATKKPPAWLVDLARLPFKIAINTTPDQLFFEALREAGKVGRQFDFYNFYRPKEYKFARPTIEAPLVFNLFGHFDVPESLVLTAGNQVDFMASISRLNPPLPASLIEEFDSRKTFLFVGFDWRGWHLQLLLKSLGLTKDSSILAPSAPGTEPSPTNKTIFTSIFNKFIFSESKLSDFVGELMSHFSPSAPVDEPKTGKKIFVSYHFDEDEGLKKQLVAQLKGLEMTGLAQIWDETKLLPGEQKDAKIAAELADAKIILLLLTAEYLSNDSLAKAQFQPALVRAAAESAKVVPVVLKPCSWNFIPELTRLSPILPFKDQTPGKAVTTWPNQDEAFQNVAEEVKKLLV